MKICPKCRKQYDDTWQVCLNCKCQLSIVPPELITELNVLKKLAGSLLNRVKLLEEKIEAFVHNRQIPLSKEAEQMPKEKNQVKQTEILSKDKDETLQNQSLESRIGRIWFNRIGALAIIFGMGFFLKYAFDNNWINETARVSLGLLAGFLMIIAGDFAYKKNFKIFSEGLITAGATTLYLSIYAAVNFYQIIADIPGFIFMAIVTLFAATFAVRFNSKRVMNFCILGGFLTPFFISVKSISPISLMCYILLLDIGVLWVGYFKKWGFCNFLSLILTYSTYFIWYFSSYSSQYFVATEFFLSIYFVLFSIIAVFYNFIQKQTTVKEDIAVIILNGIFYFLANYHLLVNKEDILSAHPGIFSILLSCLYLIFAYYVFMRTGKKDRNLVLSYLSLTLLFATITMPLELKQCWLTLGFITEAVILLWLGFRTKSNGIRYFGLALAGFALFKLVLMDFQLSFYSSDLSAVYSMFNQRFISYLWVSAGIFVCAYFYKKYKNNIAQEEKYNSTFLIIFALIVLLLGFTFEIDAYFACISSNAHKMQANQYSGKIVDSAVLENIKQFSISAVWLVYSLVLIIFGIVKKFRALRILALVIVVVTILKVFLIDISELNKIWRILSFMGLGCVLMLTSFMYQKYKDKISGLGAGK
ncbi:MAG: hypothetical protein DRP78_00945 [Candidatus Omnitrophota bacterium]|nr:MAG: hypothetical protein DRP78_00945 [Candidatus Omnitrophota bacterium]